VLSQSHKVEQSQESDTAAVTNEVEQILNKGQDNNLAAKDKKVAVVSSDKLTAEQKVKYDAWRSEQKRRIHQKEVELQEEKDRMFFIEQHKKKIEALTAKKVKLISMESKI